MTRFPVALAVLAILMVQLAVGHHHGGGNQCKATTNTGLTQMVTYVKRRSDFTRQQFWKYWEEQHAPKVAPLAAYFNITRYQQVQVGGKIPPTESGKETNSTQLVDFDGIALFLYADAEDLTGMLSHKYYLEVVEPDEHKFIDKSAFGKGMVATYVGTQVEPNNDGQDVWVGNRATHNKYQRLFDSYLHKG